MRHREPAARQELIDHLSTQQRSALRCDLDEIEALLRTVDLFKARSLVVFKSGERLNRVLRLPVRTADSLTIEADPYIEPLEAVLEEHPPVLVVDVAKEESRFWSQHLGHLDEIESLDAFVPTDRVDAGRPGKVQRHRFTHQRWHLKTAAAVAGRLFTERGFSLLVLSGDRRVLAEFERFLPDWLRGKVVGRLQPGPHQDRGEWQRQIERVLLEHRRAEEEAALARLADYQGSGLATSGLAAVLEVVTQFLVRRLSVSLELTLPGYVCPQHHFLSLDDRIRQVARRRADGDRREARAPRSPHRRGSGNLRPASGLSRQGCDEQRGRPAGCQQPLGVLVIQRTLARRLCLALGVIPITQ